MKEYEITMRVRVEADNMDTADACAEIIIADLLSDGWDSFEIKGAEWDLIAPIGNCRRKKETNE